MSLTFIGNPADQQAIGPEALSQLTTVFSQHLPAQRFLVELMLVAPEKMQELNHQQRGIDEPTDVLSFPTYHSLLEIPSHDGMPLLLGSIVICPSKASAYGETLPQLVHHGLFHLMGYDHETDLTAWQEFEHRILPGLASAGLSIPGIPTE